jgi:Tfp pilus assembly protein PilN
MYKTVEQKPIQKTVEEKRPNKSLFWPVLVLIPTILLVLILGAAMGTIVGFNSKLKGFENRINLLEESIMLKLDLNEKTLGSLQKQIAKESSRKNEPSARVKRSNKTKKNYYGKSSRPVKVLKTVMDQQYKARSNDTYIKISPPPL